MMNRFPRNATIAVVALGAALDLKADELSSYPVADIPLESEKFSEIYQQVAIQDVARRAPVSKLKVLEYLTGGMYLVLDGEYIVVLNLGLEERFADGATLSLAITDSGKGFEYGMDTGNKKLVPVYRKVPDPIPMTRAEFIERLQKGESFLVQMGIIKDRCRNCGGFGKVTDDSPKKRSPDGKIVCPECSGKGFFGRPKMFKVHW